VNICTFVSERHNLMIVSTCFKQWPRGLNTGLTTLTPDYHTYSFNHLQVFFWRTLSRVTCYKLQQIYDVVILNVTTVLWTENVTWIIASPKSGKDGLSPAETSSCIYSAAALVDNHLGINYISLSWVEFWVGCNSQSLGARQADFLSMSHAG